jgi:hypothetical protein
MILQLPTSSNLLDEKDWGIGEAGYMWLKVNGLTPKDVKSTAHQTI